MKILALLLFPVLAWSDGSFCHAHWDGVSECWHIHEGDNNHEHVCPGQYALCRHEEEESPDVVWYPSQEVIAKSQKRSLLWWLLLEGDG